MWGSWATRAGPSVSRNRRSKRHAGPPIVSGAKDRRSQVIAEEEESADIVAGQQVVVRPVRVEPWLGVRAAVVDRVAVGVDHVGLLGEGARSQPQQRMARQRLAGLQDGAVRARLGRRVDQRRRLDQAEAIVTDHACRQRVCDNSARPIRILLLGDRGEGSFEPPLAAPRPSTQIVIAGPPRVVACRARSAISAGPG